MLSSGMLKRKITPCLLFIGFLIGYAFPGQAESTPDTLFLSIAEAESRFMKGNLLLLAQKLNIEASRALEVQAGLWSNPTLYLEQSVYNPASRRMFPTQVGEAGNPASQGENIVQINQLFLLAGKRGKQINLAKINSEMAEYTFYDLVRSLKYQLRTNFFNIYYLQQSLSVYQQQIASLQKTASLYQAQYEKGNVPLKEVVRLKAFLFTLENDQKNLRTQITESQATLAVLLNDTVGAVRRNGPSAGRQPSVQMYYVPVLNRAAIDRLSLQGFQVADLVEQARSHRYDLKVYEATTRYEKQNLSYQKALAVPDIRLGGVYDRNGSYIPNYYGVNMQIDLPLFNRNQGSIQAAKSRIQASQAALEQYQVQVEKEVWQAYQKTIQADLLFKGLDPTYEADFERLIAGINLSYQKKNITLLDFIDFYESYKNNVLLLNQLQNERMNALEELNYVTGKNWFDY